MPVFADSGRLAWLKGVLASKRSQIAGLLHRLVGSGSADSANPSLFYKFLHMLDEVSAAKDEETLLIGQIEAVEQKHRFMRKHHKLRRAEPPSKIAVPDNNEEEELKARRPRNRWLWLVAVWHLLTHEKINQKKQGLTAD